EHQADGGAILGRGRIETARHDAAAGTRLIGHDDGRIAGDVLLHVAREQARIGVQAAAGSGADHDGHRPVPEQRFLSAGLVRCASEQNAGRSGAPEAKIVLTHALPVSAALAAAIYFCCPSDRAIWPWSPCSLRWAVPTWLF